MNSDKLHQPQTIAEVLAKLVPGIAMLCKQREQQQEPAAPIPPIIDNEQQPPEPEQHKEDPGIVFWLSAARKAIALKQTVCLRLWLALQHLNRCSTGSGILSTDADTQKTLANLTGLSPIRIRTIFKRGDGMWWELLPGDRLRIFGQAQVNENLAAQAGKAGVGDPFEPGIHCEMPLDILKLGLVAFHGYIFDAWLAERGPRGYMGTWKALSRLWGHSRAQMGDWIEAAGVIKQHNKGYHPYPLLTSKDDLDTQQGVLQSCPEDFGFSHGGIWLEEHEGQVNFCYQRANTYYSKQKSRRTTTAGKARKVNRAIHKCAGDIGDKVIRDALGVPGGFITHPDPDLVGVSAGQRLMEMLGELFTDITGKGGLTFLFTAWNKLTTEGRLFWKRTNYRNGKEFYKARQKRSGDMYLFQTSVRLLHTTGRSHTRWWGVWLHTQ